jgi:ribonuclease HIII
MREAPHATFAAKGPGVSVTHYTSGKLLVQGKGAEDFAATYLDDPDDVAPQAGAAPENRIEEPVIGTDESGKGDYFGPLVVAAVLVRPEDVPILRTLGVRDSKTVGDAEARRIAGELTSAYPTRIEVVEVAPPRYNEVYDRFGRNLNRLLAWCHARAIESVLEREPCERAISDKFGNERLILDALMEKGRALDLTQRVRAESHPAVAAASIVARARFLQRLDRLGREHGVKLRKGAGAPVDAVARDLFREGGIERLRDVAKLHFKTTQKAMRSR